MQFLLYNTQAAATAGFGIKQLSNYKAKYGMPTRLTAQCQKPTDYSCRGLGMYKKVE